MEQKYYRMTIAGVERDLPICPLNDKLMIAGFVIFGDPELTTACARALLDKAPEYDYMISAEATGIPLVPETEFSALRSSPSPLRRPSTFILIRQTLR